MRNSNSILVGLIMFATVYAVATCIEIEWLNYKAGGYLPHDDTQEPHSKWRWSADINEDFWKQRHRPQNANGEVDASPLTDAEKVQAKRDIERGLSENKLHELIEIRGLLQYPLSVLVMIACFWAWCWRKATMPVLKVSVITSAVAAVVVLGFAFYRGYIESLGW